ncbi:MAG: ATP-binding protein [Elusimicrobiaceae bacterium]|nr:ATP-binding protein [Elusimicrobiaceae bacterium]
MINNWDLVSRVDTKTGRHSFSLMIDGTEQEARLIAKKLAGFIKKSIPADPPFVYAFELPPDLDEATQDKIRTATREGVEQANKINQFVPGGVLGDPLFNSTSSQEGNGPLSLDLDEGDPLALRTQQVASGEVPADLTTTYKPQPPELILPAHEEGEPTFTSFIPATQVENDLSAWGKDDPISADQSASTEQAESPTPDFPLDEKDMLIKDMEGTVLDRMPLEDIFAAETKYDMFVDVEDKEKTRHAQTQRENKLSQATTSSEQEGDLDVFAQDIKEQTNVIDLKTAALSKPFTREQLSSSPKEEAETTSRQDSFLHTVRAAQPIDDALPAITLRQAPFTIDLDAPKSAEPQKKTVPADKSASRAVPAASSSPQQANKASTPKVTNLQRVKRESTPKVDPVKQGSKTILRTKSMDDKKKQTFFKLKQKTPAAPVPPAPGKPKAPQAPNPFNTIPPRPRPAEIQQRETHQPTKTPLERTRTIDHSIQVSLSELKKHNWPLEIPWVPTYTLNNMIMSVNRFAHATAMSVIASPGKMYNPLVLHGATGTGKSHFLNAMAYAFSQNFGQANVFMTNGVRLSRGIQRYIMEGNIDKFDQFISTVKVLLIDDIHLLAINEQNRAYISKLLNTFLKEQKQIVITSKYPPESLEKLEELIKFRLDSGYISELKAPTGNVQFKITKKMLMDNHIDLTDSQINSFFRADHMTLGTVQRSIRRLKVLESLLPHNIDVQQRSAAAILEKLLASKGEDQTSRIITTAPDKITSIVTMGNGEWGRIGFFYPADASDKMNWMVFSLQQRARELGIEGGPEIAVRSSYATENIISSAFKIANLCDNKKLKGAIILGPRSSDCDPSVRENFYDILTHMLEVMLIRCGIINFESVRQPSMYVKILAELMR